jgi:hypothetical protein
LNGSALPLKDAPTREHLDDPPDDWLQGDLPRLQRAVRFT